MAHDLKHDRPVALKVLLSELAALEPLLKTLKANPRFEKLIGS